MRRKIITAITVVSMLIVSGCASSGTGKSNVSSTAVTAAPPEAADPMKDIAGTYCYETGTGAWTSELTVNADGSFTGVFNDQDESFVPETEEDLIVYNFSKCHGNFVDLKKAGENSFTFGLGELVYDSETGTEEINEKEKTRVVNTTFYGMEKGKSFVFYKEGTPLKDLPENAASHAGNIMALYGKTENTETLPWNAIYSEADDSVFFNIFDK